MDFRQLELFLAVIDQASVTNAAAHMNLSTSAVSLQLRNLAEGMRTELFVKSGKRLLPTPAALLWPSPIVGKAINTAPAMPTATPAIIRGAGARRAMTAATIAVNRGLAPFSIPVIAEETCCSANGNMLRGNASQRTPTPTIPSQSERMTGFRAAGNMRVSQNR